MMQKIQEIDEKEIIDLVRFLIFDKFG